MIPHRQTLFGAGKGNCFATCVASILEVPLESLPNFCVDYEADDWFQRTCDWLREHHGCSLIMVSWGEPEKTLAMLRDFWPNTYCIVSGPGRRGCDHSVVYRGPDMVSDPHPEDSGLLAIDDVIFIVPDDPAVGCRQLADQRRMAELARAADEEMERIMGAIE